MQPLFFMIEIFNKDQNLNKHIRALRPVTSSFTMFNFVLYTFLFIFQRSSPPQHLNCAHLVRSRTAAPPVALGHWRRGAAGGRGRRLGGASEPGSPGSQQPKSLGAKREDGVRSEDGESLGRFGRRHVHVLGQI